MSSDKAALAALPEESAMRALIEHLKVSSAASGVTSYHNLPSPQCCCAVLCPHFAVSVQKKTPGHSSSQQLKVPAPSGLDEAISEHAPHCFASVLRCLAAAERLPPLDWEQLCAPCFRHEPAS